MDLKELDNIEQDNKVKAIPSNPNFATVSKIIDGKITIIIDGDSEDLNADVIKYKHVTANVGDRVHIENVSGQYLIKGVV